MLFNAIIRTSHILIPDHQSGFRHNHSTIEQVNRVYNVISNSIEERKYCSAAFLDIQQTFDKVWHPGLLYIIKLTYVDNSYSLNRTYTTDYFTYNMDTTYQNANQSSLECHKGACWDQSYILCMPQICQ